MACQNIYRNNRIWFYSLIMVFCVLIAAIFLICSFAFEKETKSYHLRKILAEIGYTSLGTALFSIIAVIYEIIKGEDPEILNIIGSLNNESSINMRVQNNLSPSQSSRSMELVRTMRENARHRALERIRSRTHRTLSGINISRLDLNHTNDLPQVDGNVTQELSPTETVELSTQSSEVGNSSGDITPILNDRTAISDGIATTPDSLESALGVSTVQHRTLDLRATDEQSANSESFNATRTIRHSCEMVDFKYASAMLFKSLPVNAQNVSRKSFHNYQAHVKGTNMNCRHHRDPRI